MQTFWLLQEDDRKHKKKSHRRRDDNRSSAAADDKESNWITVKLRAVARLQKKQPQFGGLLNQPDYVQ